MLSRLTGVGLVLPLLVVGAQVAAPPKARAGDAEKIIAAVAVGALVYGLMDDRETHHHHYYSRGSCDGVPEYYRPSRGSAYRHGYNDGFRDGYSYGYSDGRYDGERIGYRRGYAHGYSDGRRDQWIEDVGCYYRPPKPVVVGPWPWF
ncbi:MAG: hypothetical protein H5T86_04235 [Armatimonadetes bacterium]|nr:hypothetical protein [Armatimonadota bacterium]